MEQAFLFLGIKHQRIVFSSKFLMKKNQQFQVSVREKLSYSKFVICQTKALQVLGLREGFLRHSRLLENSFHSKKKKSFSTVSNIFARLHLFYGHLIFHIQSLESWEKLLPKFCSLTPPTEMHRDTLIAPNTCYVIIKHTQVRSRWHDLTKKEYYHCLMQPKNESGYRFWVQKVWHPNWTSLYRQKQLKRKILIKNGITFILKSVHKEPFSWKQSLSLKQRIFVRTKLKITQKTYLSAIFLDVVMLQRLDTFISPPKFKSCIRPWLSQTHGDCFWSLGQLQKNTIKNSAPFLWH